SIAMAGTALRGQILRFNGKPLRGVTVSIGNIVTQTDQSGYFMLGGLPNGHQELVVDGRSASSDGKKYSVYVIGLKLKPNRLNELDYAIWMPMIRNIDSTKI